MLIGCCSTPHMLSCFIPSRNTYGSEVLPPWDHLTLLLPAGIQSLPFLLHPSFSDTGPRHLLFHPILLRLCSASGSFWRPLQCDSVRGQFSWFAVWNVPWMPCRARSPPLTLKFNPLKGDLCIASAEQSLACMCFGLQTCFQESYVKCLLMLTLKWMHSLQDYFSISIILAMHEMNACCMLKDINGKHICKMFRVFHNSKTNTMKNLCAV